MAPLHAISGFDLRSAASEGRVTRSEPADAMGCGFRPYFCPHLLVVRQREMSGSCGQEDGDKDMPDCRQSFCATPSKSSGWWTRVRRTEVSLPANGVAESNPALWLDGRGRGRSSPVVNQRRAPTPCRMPRNPGLRHTAGLRDRHQRRGDVLGVGSGCRRRWLIAEGDSVHRRLLVARGMTGLAPLVRAVQCGGYHSLRVTGTVFSFAAVVDEGLERDVGIVQASLL